MEAHLQIFTIEELRPLFPLGVRGLIHRQFDGISTDTRKIKPGMIFLALAGENFDGHNFLMQAVEKGAAAVVVNAAFDVPEEVERQVTVFAAEDTLKAYQAIGRLWREKFDIPVIAITGSNGKTTTKDLTAAVLSGKYKVLKTEANFNNEIGLPLTLLNLRPEHEAAVVEMGMRGLGQIAELVAIAEPNVGVVTNVGETHMELLGSLENIARAKGELPEGIPADGKVILNADDVLVAAMAKKTKAQVITFGLKNEATVYAKDVVFDNAGFTKFTVVMPIGTLDLQLPILGMHNVYNALAGIAVGYSQGFTAAEIAAGLANYQATKMRFEAIEFNGMHLINDAYNASPMSTKAALENLKIVAQGRKILVMGDMFELGNVEETAHRNIGLWAADLQLDAVFTRGELTRFTAEEARDKGVKEVAAFASHEDLAQYLKQYLQPGDTVLFKGSHGMHMEKVIELLKELWG